MFIFTQKNKIDTHATNASQTLRYFLEGFGVFIFVKSVGVGVLGWLSIYSS